MYSSYRCCASHRRISIIEDILFYFYADFTQKGWRWGTLWRTRLNSRLKCEVASEALNGYDTSDRPESPRICPPRVIRRGYLSSVGIVVGIREPGGAAAFEGRTLIREKTVRRVLRFGQKITGKDVPSVPERYRGFEGPKGKLVGARLRSQSGEVWLRLRPGRLNPLEKSVVRTIPLNGSQAPAPVPEALELLDGMRVTCHEGYVGRLTGVMIDMSVGIVSDLIVRVRTDVATEMAGPTVPLARLLDVSGQDVLLSPSWATSTKEEPHRVLARGSALTLRMDATAEQIASGARIRADGEVAGDIWSMLDANPAIVPYTGSITVNVHDGEVTITGSVPTPRHRASAEQDIWHVPGVFSLRNDLRVGG